ncbi:MAG: hydrogenase expression/formation protein HypE [Bacteriovoracaceae bacterium]|nr:hydrogenase expression/formation protein HypE [Bacteriovoracaceae bacterium]
MSQRYTDLDKSININHGSGGRLMHEFINKHIAQKLQNGILEKFDDSAILKNAAGKRIAMSTDSYVVSPLFFPGGDIGSMCVSGTVNDVTTSGAVPYTMSLSFILEEGVDLEVIDKIIDSIAKVAKEADIKIVTGDTKVVEAGKGDQIYINTCAIGFIDDDVNISTYNATVGDSVIVTGPIGNHEVAMLKAKQMIDFEIDTVSDVAPLNKLIENVLSKTKKINVIKDPTRGGLASALIEICDHSNCEIVIKEKDIPVDKDVAAVCELIGYDPLYLANEGKFIIICNADVTDTVLQSLGPNAKLIGTVTSKDNPQLTMETLSHGRRRIGMLETSQLPRIC